MCSACGNSVRHPEGEAAPQLGYGDPPDPWPRPFVDLEVAINYMRSYGGTTDNFHDRRDWAGAANHTINYFIPQLAAGTTLANSEYDDRALYVNSMSATKINQARNAFELWDDLMAYDLNQLPSFDAATGTANNFGLENTIQFYYHSGTDGTDAPSLQIDEPVVLNSLGGIQERMWGAMVEFRGSDARTDGDADVAFGSYGFEIYLHEIGHSLGFWHPGPYNGTAAQSQVYMAQDNRQYTVMSYLDPGQNGSEAVWGTLSVQTPMVYDIAAIQAVYGASTLRTGNDIYGWGAFLLGSNLSTQNAHSLFSNRGGVFSIYDSGGTDKLSGAGFNDNQLIDLTPGSYSSIGRVNGQTGLELEFNIGIAFNTIIENAESGSGNDRLIGNDANNLLIGNDGHDTFSGGLGSNILRGGAGDDTYLLGDGADTIVETSGFDTVQFSTATVLDWRNNFSTGDPSNDLFQEADIDRYLGSAGSDTVLLRELTEGDRIFIGGNGADTFQGALGNDVLQGGTGNDTLRGGLGINTGDFSDHYGNQSLGWTIDLVTQTASTLFSSGFTLFTETDTLSSIDNVIGSAGHDFIQVSENSNSVIGGAGADTVSLLAQVEFFSNQGQGFGYADANDRVNLALGWSQTDILNYVNGVPSVLFTRTLALDGIENLRAGAGNDQVVGSRLANSLYGEAGGDTLNGDTGDDRLAGGLGADAIIGGTGIDTVDWSDAIGAIVFTLGAAGNGVTSNIAGAGQDTLTGIENMIGGAAGDTLGGNAGNNVIDGGGGGDRLIGGLGDDTLAGGLGADTADWSAATGAVAFALGVSGDGATSNSAGIGRDTVTGIENMIGGSAGDTLSGNAFGNVIEGGAGGDAWLGGGGGSDTIGGGGGNDRIDGGEDGDGALDGDAGDDTITGGGGDDTGNGGDNDDKLYGQAGRDRLNGGNGADTLYGGDEAGAGDILLAGDGGNDHVQGGLGDDRIDGGSENDKLYGEAGNDTVTGGLGNDRLEGGANTDVLYGQDGDDTMLGGDGADTLYGGIGLDRLYGNTGDDFLQGDAGNDNLYGGAGLDRFNFDLANGSDAIFDFTNDQDTLIVDPGFGFANAAAVVAATIQTGNHARILLPGADTDIYLWDYLRPGSGNTIGNLGNDIAIG